MFTMMVFVLIKAMWYNRKESTGVVKENTEQTMAMQL